MIQIYRSINGSIYLSIYLSYPTLPYPILSYPILSYLILSLPTYLPTYLNLPTYLPTYLPIYPLYLYIYIYLSLSSLSILSLSLSVDFGFDQCLSLRRLGKRKCWLFKPTLPFIPGRCLESPSHPAMIGRTKASQL